MKTRIEQIVAKELANIKSKKEVASAEGIAARAQVDKLAKIMATTFASGFDAMGSPKDTYPMYKKTINEGFFFSGFKIPKSEEGIGSTIFSSFSKATLAKLYSVVAAGTVWDFKVVSAGSSTIVGFEVADPDYGN